MKLYFYKESTGDWYVELLHYPGPKSDLQMVAGADKALDIISKGKQRIRLDAFTSYDIPAPKVARLTLEMICADEYYQLQAQGCPSSGAFYQCNIVGIKEPLSVWLCDVTKFVFGKFPEFLYIY